MASEAADPVALVFDTSVFTNPDATRQWGGGPREAFAGLLPLAEGLRHRVSLYMPLSIHDELKTFLSGQVPPELELIFQLRSPDRYAQMVPGSVLYQLIEDVRLRIDKGLRVAEKAVRATEVGGVEQTIARLRDQYRTALRSGLLDSREDVDLILLARELDGALVTSDQGVRDWAERLGVRLVDPLHLRAMLEGLQS